MAKAQAEVLYAENSVHNCYGNSDNEFCKKNMALKRKYFESYESKKILLFLTCTVILFGCSNMFRPPPYAFEQWKKKGVSIEETKKNMLECGYPNVAGAGREPDNNKIALMHLCMESHGFKYTGEFGTFCKSYPNLPACVEARNAAAAQKSKKTN